MTLPEVTTATNTDAALCTFEPGARHDYRPHTYEQFGRPHTSWRCVWCHVVACGDYGDEDPCMEPYHHHGDHLTQSGARWRIGGWRPNEHRA